MVAKETTELNPPATAIVARTVPLPPCTTLNAVALVEKVNEGGTETVT
jgi:hypothetical protein